MSNKLSTFQKIRLYKETQLADFLGVFVLVLVEILVFVFATVNYKFNPSFKTSNMVLGWSFLIARGTSLPIEFNTGIIMLPMCRNVISALRSTSLNKVVPFDKNIEFHKAIGWSVLFFSVVHSLAHFVNFYKLNQLKGLGFWNLMFFTGPGLTGNIMLAALITLVTCSISKVRNWKFEAFWYTHHLFALYFALYSIHGGFCLIPRDTYPFCSDAQFYKYWTLSGILYLHERVSREIKGLQTTIISRVVEHPSNVVEVQFKKKKFNMRAGQYIFLCCPAVSIHQFHPFTLTSAPEDDYISVHVRMVGDFTKEFGKKLGCGGNGEKGYQSEPVLPRIMVDGPFGSASEDVFDYEVSVLVGAGIGVTPFASILRSVWYKLYTANKNIRLSKAYFIWVCRDKDAFEWFQSLLSVIEQEDTKRFIEINTFLTGKLKGNEIANLAVNYGDKNEDAITRLKSKTQFGRPNFEQIFTRIKRKHKSTDVGVFFCGPVPLGNNLQANCEKCSEPGKDGTKFRYNKENF